MPCSAGSPNTITGCPVLLASTRPPFRHGLVRPFSDADLANREEAPRRHWADEATPTDEPGVGPFAEVGVTGAVELRARQEALDEAVPLEEVDPPLPARRQKPEAVDEDDGGRGGPIGARDLLGLAVGDRLGLGAGHLRLPYEVEDILY